MDFSIPNLIQIQNAVKKSQKRKSMKRKGRASLVYKLDSSNESNKQYFLGYIRLGTCNASIPEESKGYEIMFKENDVSDNLVVDFDDGSTAIIHLLFDAPVLKDVFGSKLFSISLRKEMDEFAVMDVYFKTLPVYNKQKKALQSILAYLFKIEAYTNKPEYDPETLHSVYSKIKQRQKNDELPSYEVSTLFLRPQLREYQRKSVNWMLHREMSDLMDDEILYPPYMALKLPTGTEIYCDSYSGSVVLEKPTTKPICKGGILADEMGLGKTVEILALILSNKKPGENDEINISEVVINQSTKRPIHKTEEPRNTAKPEPKKLKVPSEFVKNKSEIRMRLQEWYKLNLASVNSRPALEKHTVFCICGLFDENNLVACAQCGKAQHFKCMGFERNSDEDYYCPQCWKLKPLLESKATLIVFPSTLKEQWEKEICSHVKQGLRVLYYAGTQAVPVYPTNFLKYDIVLTTYSTIQNELRQAEQFNNKNLRQKSRYGSPGSPISRIKWWRLCFDEGQLVEGKVLQMADKLESEYRWAITGTPMSKGLLDLPGIIEFLKIKPYDDPDVWLNSMYLPYIHGVEEPIYNLISKILWRTEKADVLNQINIPEQTFEKHILELESVERFMYNKEHELCRTDFFSKLEKFDPLTPLKSLHNNVLKQLLVPVISLRQVCCLRNSIKGRYLVTKKSMNSMQELLDALISKNLTDCEEDLRYLVSSLNGQGGLHLLNNNVRCAVDSYRKVLQLAAEYSEENNKSSGIKLNIDKLLLIHAMYNLAETLDVYKPSERTLRDDQLRSDCLALEKKYCSRFEKETIVAIKVAGELTEKIDDLLKGCTMSEGQWYSGILEYITTNGSKDELINKYNNSFTTMGYDMNTLYSNEESLNIHLKEWEESVYDLREDALKALFGLFEMRDDGGIDICPILVREVADCHLRPNNKKNKGSCRICICNNKLNTLESKLFSSKKRDDASNLGSWKVVVEEIWLKGIYNFGKQKNLNELATEGQIHLKILDCFKKEFKELRKTWTYLDSQTCAFDELDMCKSRIELSVEKGESENKTHRDVRNLLDIESNNKLNIVAPHEIAYQLSFLESEEAQREKMLEKKLGTQKYLLSLNNQDGKGQKPDPCPICKSQLEKRWNVLTCGHCYCYDCLEILLSRAGGYSFSCSICRQTQRIKDINFIEIKEDVDVKLEETEEIKIIGESSTKVEGITKLILKLLSDDSSVKIIVFSNWLEVLRNLSRMFMLNKVRSVIYLGNAYQKQLDKFKDISQEISVLLLPLNLGCKGLNLIEATHVIFAEPVLDPATEYQAIGRVHRIGQTKPTKVHKFIIKDSIEENIDSAISTQGSEWSSDKITLQQIRKLFETDFPLY